MNKEKLMRNYSEKDWEELDKRVEERHRMEEEKYKRENGIHQCKQMKMKTGTPDIYISFNRMRISGFYSDYTTEFEINCCPWCGEELEERKLR